MMGRRPNRSDHAPKSGENRNCINAHANAKYPVTAAARAISPPSNCFTRFGSTGAMMPSDRKSSVTVMMMKMNAALEAVRGAAGCAEVESLMNV
jgi:hypothetical protein